MQTKPEAQTPAVVIPHPETPQPVSDSIVAAKPQQAYTVKVTEVPQTHRDVADWMALGINGVLAVVGIIGVTVAVRTLRVLRRQTNVMERSTKAAEVSAEASRVSAEASLNQVRHALRSDRPWIVVEYETDPFLSGTVEFTARNRGKSPARVTMSMAERRIIPFAEAELEPLYGIDGRYLEAQWRMPKDRFLVGKLAFDLSVLDDAEQWQGKSILVFQGFVRYEDTISEDVHETRFCYQVLVDSQRKIQLKMFGGKGYNTMT